MKQVIRLTIFSCICVALALAAVAGSEALPSGKEMKEVAPAPPPECDWTGFYIGLNAGGQFSHSENKNLDIFDGLGREWGHSESSFVGGGQLGYNWQWRWLVLGAEADAGYMDLDGRGVEPGSPQRFAPVFGESDSDFYTTLRGRLGLALRNWLIYGTGGAIGINYESRIACPQTELVGDKQEFDWGYCVGGGIEYRLGRHWSLKTEYLYFGLDRQTFDAAIVDHPVSAVTPRFHVGETFRFSENAEGNIIRCALNYKF